MIHKAKLDFDITLNRSWLIGDKASDIHCGLSAGVKPILVLTGYGKQERALLSDDLTCATDILSASSLIISESVNSCDLST